VAQSTTPAGQERWSSVFGHLGADADAGSIADLTIGYRVPEPILTVANRLLPFTGVESTASRSVRRTGELPTWHLAKNFDLAGTVAEVATGTKRRRRVSGVVAPARMHEAIEAALLEHGLVSVDHVHELGPDELPLFDPERVKGLEFDGVIVVNPHEILSEGTADDVTPRGARLLYVAMTRAVQELHFVTDAERPALLAD
jgi:DNA helicase IV